MFVSVLCPNCSARINVPEQRLGRTIRCPRCLGDVPTEVDEPEAEPADELEAVEDEPQPLTRRKTGERPDRSDDSIDRPRKRKKKKKKRSEAEEEARRWLIWVAVGGGVLGIGLVALLIWGLNSAFRTEPPPTIPAERWQPVEVPNRMKVLFPGGAGRQVISPAGIQTVLYSCTPDKDVLFAAAYSEGPLPDAIRNMQLEAILNDSCDGALFSAKQAAGGKGVHELSRESVSIGPHKGKELVVEIQAREGGQLILRTFYHEGSGRRYFAMCGGKNYEADQPNVRKFLESFQILDNGLPDPPSEEKKKPADKKKGPAGPQGPALPKEGPPKEGPKK
jgi:Zn-finger nucleic acid-binding protein